MKKVLLPFVLIFCCSLSCLAATADHTVAELNLAFKTLDGWTRQTVAATPAGGEPGWTVTVSKDAPPAAQAPVSILVVDGRENQVYQDMSADLQSSKAAGNLAEMIIQDNRVQQNQKGYQIISYRLEKIGRVNFLVIISENLRQKLRALQAITFLNGYSYTVATKINLTGAPQDIQAATENFNIIAASLLSDKKPVKT